ncbi:MAG: Hsp20/alpha crystallin family protein [Limnothrix sp.]
MSLVRFSPFAEFDTVQAQMNRLFDELTTWPAEEKSAWRPAVELLNNDTHLTLKVALPGITAENVDVHVTRESVRISGEYKYDKKAENNGVYHSEFRYGKFDRAIGLPVVIDHENVVANFEAGVLTLQLPKIVPTSKKVVKLNLGQAETNVEATDTATETATNTDHE